MFDSYITTILQRDVRDLSNIEKLAAVPRLLTLLASRICALLNCADTARALSMSQMTLRRYLALLEATFLIVLLPAWSSNLGKRLIKSPKLLLGDTGLLGHALGLDRERLNRERTLLGHVLENFVAMELTKQLGWSQSRSKLFHFRTAAGTEVDFVLENPAGQLVGIEVKSAKTIQAKDFRGLKALADLTGDRFQGGFVLNTGSTIVPFAKNLHAHARQLSLVIRARQRTAHLFSPTTCRRSRLPGGCRRWFRRWWCGQPTPLALDIPSDATFALRSPRPRHRTC